MNLVNRKIVIIGGTSGIGYATTEILSNSNANLIITGRNKSKLEKMESEMDNVISTSAFDFTNEKAVKAFFDSIDQFDDLVIVAAGAPKTGLFLSNNGIENITNYINQKLIGVLYTAKYGIQKMSENGSVTFFIGGAGRKAYPTCTPLAVVNTAIVGFAKTLTVEIQPKRVNVISIGVVETDAWNYMDKEEREKFFKECAEGNLLKRIGSAEDVAKAVMFLLTSDYVNGIVLDVLGGETVDLMH